MSEEVRNNGGIIIHIILATYLIFGLGTICDDFFVPVLEIISEKFHLSNDVAGATFMAAGKYVYLLLLSLSLKDRVPKTRILGSRLLRDCCGRKKKSHLPEIHAMQSCHKNHHNVILITLCQKKSPYGKSHYENSR